VVRNFGFALLAIAKLLALCQHQSARQHVIELGFGLRGNWLSLREELFSLSLSLSHSEHTLNF